jgi:hypothetical protein
MATADNPPEGAYPKASNYPNPLANNVNMHPYPYVTVPGATPFPATRQDAPIKIDGAGGSAFKA